MKQSPVIFLIFFLLHLSIQGYAQVKQRILRDKFSFETASDMYSVADTLPFDSKAADLIEKISKQLALRHLPEEDIVLVNLIKLEPYRFTKQVQDVVFLWAEVVKGNDHIGKKQKKQYEEPELYKLMDSVTVLYHNREFEKVINLSRKVLNIPHQSNQEMYSIRNNMALAMMHKKMDLCALLELEIIKKLEPEEMYIPAIINLSVIYERFGKSEESKQLIQLLLDKKVNVPMLNFNAEWWRIGDNSAPAGKELKNSEIEKYQLLANHFDLNFYARSLFDLGLIRKNMGIVSNWAARLVFILFSVLLLFFIRSLLVGINSNTDEDPGWVTIILLLLFIVFFYFLMMGNPIVNSDIIFAIFYIILFPIIAGILYLVRVYG